MALRYADPGNLAEELGLLKNYSLAQAEDAAKRAALKWQMLTFVAMGVAVALAVVSMFMPVIQLYQQVTVN